VPWRVATVVEVVAETSSARTLVLEIPGWPGHAAGQHVDIRLTAEDGYQAQRAYSIATAPEDPRVAITVERLDDGEVSPYLVDEVREGDRIEVRGPIGGHFTWRATQGGPLLMVGGGSGVVPLMSMLRHHAAAGSDADARLLLSAMGPEDVIYRDELEALGGGPVRVHVTLTRRRPPGWTGYDRRVDAAMLAEVGPPPSDCPMVFVCGPTAFVETVADLLVGMGHPPLAVRTERFGGTGR
jgi:ferredoxin-NADP reductase